MLPEDWKEYRRLTVPAGDLPVPWFVEELVQWREENQDALADLRERRWERRMALGVEGATRVYEGIVSGT